MSSRADANFVRQQGFPEASDGSCGRQFSALNFQPRIVGPLAVLGVLLQSPALFLTLSALLWWSARSASRKSSWTSLAVAWST